ncbi:MAG: zinc-dependent alcohol dehydrogenase [Tepidiformaceae bacterium]
MNAAAWTGECALAVVDLPEPEPGPGETLVRVTGCGICGTDLHLYRGHFVPPAGAIPGHEITGTVVAGGPFAPGTPVAVEPVLGCLQCPSCRQGAPHRCRSLRLMGISAPGGLQELLTAPTANVHALPEGLDPALGSLAEPLAVCVRGVHLADVALGARALVLGAGTIGLMTAMLLRDIAGEIAITARYPQQRDLALKLGASAAFDPESGDVRAWTKERQPDVVIETVGGAADTLSEALRAVRAGGTVVALGVFTERVSIPAFKLVNEEVRLVGSVMYGRRGDQAEFAIGVDRLARYREDLPRFATHSFPLAEANDAFAAAADKASGALKVTIRPNG